MPKPISLDPDRKKKRKRKKRKVDYSVYLVPPTVPDKQCIHTTKPLDASMCSQCLSMTPSVVKRPPQTDWWADEDDFIEEVPLDEVDEFRLDELLDDDI